METLGKISSSEGQVFEVCTGISPALIDRLIHASWQEDEALIKFTGDPKRFADRRATEQWLHEEGRKTYTLTPEADINTLAWFAWLRADPKIHIPDSSTDGELLEKYRATEGDGTHTVAARLYGDFRGKKLATPFMCMVHQDYMSRTKGAVSGIIADIHQDNIASQKLFQRLGYQLLWPKWDRTLWILDAAHMGNIQ